jgi:outer membrane protein assembly factor BamE (lipoprotein component of BamABCDE complex)
MKQTLFKLTVQTIFPAVLLAALSGCALFQPNDDICETDPVACAAMSQRPADERRDLASMDAPEPLPTRQLILGMNRTQVRSLWGQPQNVETAGENQLGNERWTYYNGLSGPWSISQSRIVYFEKGRVVGWETGR